MIQEIVVVFAFIGAVGYLGNVIYKQLQAKSACAVGCGKCSVVDFEKIEKQLNTKTSRPTGRFEKDRV